MQPMDMPSRSLNAAIDLRALVTTGFWPAICVSSFTAPSISLRVLRGFAQADVERDLLDLGHGHHVLVPELLGQGREPLSF